VLLSPRSQAYAQVKQWHPSLVVIDMGFDDSEGCQLLTMLTLDPDTRHTPVLILAASDVPQDQEVDRGPSTRFWLESLPGLA
jgi:CheY-like chemotaxis protein